MGDIHNLVQEKIQTWSVPIDICAFIIVVAVTMMYV